MENRIEQAIKSQLNHIISHDGIVAAIEMKFESLWIDDIQEIISESVINAFGGDITKEESIQADILFDKLSIYAMNIARNVFAQIVSELKNIQSVMNASVNSLLA